jgi:dTDP-4-dehydrorhamnose 3,5-epimerase
MKIIHIGSLEFPEVKVIRAAKYRDARGYFYEPFRRSEIERAAPFLRGVQFPQSNASFSRAGTVRGMHFQWDPPMGKLVRTVHGRMIDLVLDVRPISPTYGRIAAVDMPASEEWADLIWVPPGFAHGNVFPMDTYIEYLCSGEYNPRGEAGVSLLAPDIDWSGVNSRLREEIQSFLGGATLMTEKDRTALTAGAWARDPRASSPVFSAGPT